MKERVHSMEITSIQTDNAVPETSGLRLHAGWVGLDYMYMSKQPFKGFQENKRFIISLTII